MNCKSLLCGVALLTSAIPAAADLQINEVMQSNLYCIMDDLNEYPDSWVELYNNSSSIVKLSDYALSVKNKYSDAYRLPDRSVAPGEYVIVYCDKTDHTEFPNALMHTNFRIDSGKGSVYLWKGEKVLEELTLAKMPAPNISYGRETESSSKWGYQSNPTPKTANCRSLVSKLLPDPIFSTEGGLLRSSIDVKISKPGDAPKNAEIYYTLDGTVPTVKANKYSSPINVSKNTVLRAVLIADGYMSPLAVTHSYIFHPIEQTIPIVSITGDPDCFYGDKTGILTEGTYTEGTPNYMYNWRRPINIEYFETDGSCPINQVVETRIKGSSSRKKPLRSMVVYANKRFGVKRLEHEFFPEQKPSLTDFKSLEFRNAGQDFHELFMRDALCQRNTGQYVDLDWAASQPTVVYVNGNYIGMLNLRERSNEDYIYTNYDGLEDVDVIENWYEVSEGSNDLNAEFQAFFREDGHSAEEYKERMDITEFLNLMISEIVYCTTDFPGNNIIMWRPTAENGKWRWIAKDLDSALGSLPQQWDFKYLTWLYDPKFDTSLGEGNAPSATLLFRQLMKIDEVKDEFINRMLAYMGDFMKPSSLTSLMEKMWDNISAEHPYFKTLYDFDWEWNKHDVLRAKAKEWYTNRINFMYSHTSEFFELGKPVKFTVDNECNTPIGLSINGINLTNDSFDGQWPTGREIKLKGDNGGWEIYAVSPAGEESKVAQSGDAEIAFTPAENADIASYRAVYTGNSGIDEIISENETGKTEWYTLEGLRLGNRPTEPGLYISRNGNKSRKIMIKR